MNNFSNIVKISTIFQAWREIRSIARGEFPHYQEIFTVSDRVTMRFLMSAAGCVQDFNNGQCDYL